MTEQPQKRDNQGLISAFRALRTVLGRAFKGANEREDLSILGNQQDGRVAVEGKRQPRIQALDLNLTAEEFEAEQLDDGNLYGLYESDEREVELYDGLFFNDRRGEWQARFIPTDPERRTPNWIEIYSCLFQPESNWVLSMEGDTSICRFVQANPVRPDRRCAEATLSEVMEFANMLNNRRVKPSQALRALTAFGVRLDRAVAKLEFS